MAADLGLRVAEKKDSQEICFVTSDRYDEFVRRRHSDDDRSGELVTTDGTVVGRHRGIEGFTVGQRKGLGVALGDRKFVVRIEPESRRVVIGDRDGVVSARADGPGRELAWRGVANDASGEMQRCFAQIRYNAAAQPATMTRAARAAACTSVRRAPVRRHAGASGGVLRRRDESARAGRRLD